MMPSKLVFWKSNFTPSTCPSALPRSASKPSTVLLSVSKNSIGGKLTPEATRTVPEERMSSGRAAARVASLASVEAEADPDGDAAPPEDEDAGLAASGAAHPEPTAAVARAPTRTRERSRMVISRGVFQQTTKVAGAASGAPQCRVKGRSRNDRTGPSRGGPARCAQCPCHRPTA